MIQRSAMCDAQVLVSSFRMQVFQNSDTASRGVRTILMYSNAASAVHQKLEANNHSLLSLGADFSVIVDSSPPPAAAGGASSMSMVDPGVSSLCDLRAGASCIIGVGLMQRGCLVFEQYPGLLCALIRLRRDQSRR